MCAPLCPFCYRSSTTNPHTTEVLFSSGAVKRKSPSGSCVFIWCCLWLFTIVACLSYNDQKALPNPVVHCGTWQTSPDHESVFRTCQHQKQRVWNTLHSDEGTKCPVQNLVLVLFAVSPSPQKLLASWPQLSLNSSIAGMEDVQLSVIKRSYLIGRVLHSFRISAVIG